MDVRGPHGCGSGSFGTSPTESVRPNIATPSGANVRSAFAVVVNTSGTMPEAGANFPP